MKCAQESNVLGGCFIRFTCWTEWYIVHVDCKNILHVASLYRILWIKYRQAPEMMEELSPHFVDSFLFSQISLLFARLEFDFLISPRFLKWIRGKQRRQHIDENSPVFIHCFLKWLAVFPAAKSAFLLLVDTSSFNNQKQIVSCCLHWLTAEAAVSKSIRWSSGCPRVSEDFLSCLKSCFSLLNCDLAVQDAAIVETFSQMPT